MSDGAASFSQAIRNAARGGPASSTPGGDNKNLASEWQRVERELAAAKAAGDGIRADYCESQLDQLVEQSRERRATAQSQAATEQRIQTVMAEQNLSREQATKFVTQPTSFDGGARTPAPAVQSVSEIMNGALRRAHECRYYD